jgi:putative FmdB family regulatory protein
MPIYEFGCEKCGRVTEALQRYSDPPLASCPHCGGPVKKRFSAPAFQFKGQGWYATDYAKKSGAPAAGKAESAPAKDATAGEKEAPAGAASPTPKAEPTSGAKPPSAD